MFQDVDPKTPLPKLEEKILEYWEKENIFKQSVDRRIKGKKYVFFDGPPFANGLPHYGHIMANALKDAVTRYWSMKGYYVPRRNGWDCHGLPVEYEIEKELELSGKKDIETYGIEKFNQKCRESVFRYTREWETLLKRIARWVDFDDSYATLDNNYMESIWWVFKKIWEKGLVSKGYKVMHICPRCETPLSNFEVSQGYKDVTDLSVTVKLQLLDKKYEGVSILAWTTTPWTLPGNVALAVGKDLNYVKIQLENKEKLILCKNRLKIVQGEYKILSEMKGKDLVGLKYKPLFDIKKLQNENSHKVILADFVTTEEGTGIVHTAGMYGEEDYAVCFKNDIPLIHTVKYNGTFNSLVPLWQGKFVKNIEQNIAQYLEEKGLLFSKNPYRHSYPHCWRCDTPLLNYATDSWFINVPKIKDLLLKNNQKIHWVPEHLRDGRFGKWLEGAREWAISRNRFWGCPIPIWQCECGFEKCIGGISELRQNSTNGNNLFVIRHGEAEHNVLGILSSDPHVKHKLTKKGQEQAKNVAEKLENLPNNRKIELIFSSPFPRTLETANIISKKLGGVPIETDDRLREISAGEDDGKNAMRYLKKAKKSDNFYEYKPLEGESLQELEERTTDFLNYLSAHFKNKNILIVTHGGAVITIDKYLRDIPATKKLFESTWITPFDQIHEYYSGQIPNRKTKEGKKLDLHKPYIDNVELRCEQCGKHMKRIPEVLDCWFESGSMPYAQLHYPFEKKDEFEATFPANFIAEGLDQTRGWFYTLHVLSTILFEKPAFKNVIVNGILLAADGEKLSKRKKNYPDPNELFNSKGVDSTRFFLYSSTAPLAEDVRFSEAHVDDIFKRFTLTLWNTYSFFVTYANIDKWKPSKTLSSFNPNNKLDQWILSELNALIAEVTEQMDNYNLTKATRPMIDFVDNLSNWYIRRSRRRFWKSKNDADKKQAYNTLYIVLTEFSQILAPFMPFTAEEIYRNLTDEESVHFTDWPEAQKRFIRKDLNKEMSIIRKIVTLGHSARAQAGMKVRQPLQSLKVALPENVSPQLIEGHIDVIKEELNIKHLELDKKAVEEAVKEICKPNPKILGPKYGKDVQEILESARNGQYEKQAHGRIKIGDWILEPEEIEIGFKSREGMCAVSEGGIVVVLDTNVTEELKKEGYVREMIRVIQDMRKDAGYKVQDRIYVYIKSSDIIEKAITEYSSYILKETLGIELRQSGDLEWDLENKIELDGIKVTLAVKK